MDNGRKPSAHEACGDAPWLVLLAAGKGTRLAAQTGGRPKQFLRYRGRPLYWQSVCTCVASGLMGGVVLVLPMDEFEENRARALEFAREEKLPFPLLFARGGARRQDSVLAGLRLVPEHVSHVLVHDAARPFFSADLCRALLQRLREGACAVIPGLAVKDTIKQVDGEGTVLATPDRSALRAVQTPQGFDRRLLLEAHKALNTEANTVTDDASLMEAAGHRVSVVDGEEANLKITTAADLQSLAQAVPCTGFGYDVHRYGGTRPLVLGGLAIPSEYTIAAHSDGDVLLHALMDALLGMIGKGDIGELFPDSDPAFDGASSVGLLARVLELVREAGVTLTHADVTVIAQKPRLGAYKKDIRANLAALLGLGESHVNVKATTEEGLGFTGELLGIKACAIVAGIAKGTPGRAE